MQMERHEWEAKRLARKAEEARRAYNALEYIKLAAQELNRIERDEWHTEACIGLNHAVKNLSQKVKSLDPKGEAKPTIDVQLEPLVTSGLLETKDPDWRTT